MEFKIKTMDEQQLWELVLSLLCMICIQMGMKKNLPDLFAKHNVIFSIEKDK